MVDSVCCVCCVCWWRAVLLGAVGAAIESVWAARSCERGPWTVGLWRLWGVRSVSGGGGGCVSVLEGASQELYCPVQHQPLCSCSEGATYQHCFLQL